MWWQIKRISGARIQDSKIKGKTVSHYSVSVPYLFEPPLCVLDSINNVVTNYLKINELQ